MDKGQYRDVNARPLPGFVSMVHGRVPLKVLSEAGRQMEYATTHALACRRGRIRATTPIDRVLQGILTSKPDVPALNVTWAAADGIERVRSENR